MGTQRESANINYRLAILFEVLEEYTYKIIKLNNKISEIKKDILNNYFKIIILFIIFYFYLKSKKIINIILSENEVYTIHRDELQHFLLLFMSVVLVCTFIKHAFLVLIAWREFRKNSRIRRIIDSKISEVARYASEIHEYYDLTKEESLKLDLKIAEAEAIIQ